MILWLKLIHFMNWNKKDYIWWSFPVFFAVVDLLTTYIGMQQQQLREANMFVNSFSGSEFWILMIVLKVLAIGLGVFFYQYFDFYNKWFIPALLGLVWKLVSINNIIVILIVI